MQGLNRKILYRREAPAEQPAKEVGPTKKVMASKQDLIEWLAAHPLINISGLAAACGIDRANLTRWIKEGSIPEKHRGKIEGVLKDYGYCKS